MGAAGGTAHRSRLHRPAVVVVLHKVALDQRLASEDGLAGPMDAHDEEGVEEHHPFGGPLLVELRGVRLAKGLHLDVRLEKLEKGRQMPFNTHRPTQ